MHIERPASECFLFSIVMAERQSKWDRPTTESNAASHGTVARSNDIRPAAKMAAAAAARIAAQFAKPDPAAPGALVRHPDLDEDAPDGAFTHDIEINDHRNRYLLTKGQTQEDLRQETGARVYTRGTWYPDRTMIRPNEPPLYLHITADSRESLNRCIARINNLMVQDLPPLLDDRLHRNDPRASNEEIVPINLEPLRNFNVRAKIVGPSGLFVKYIQHETRVRVQIKGRGSGYLEGDTGRELQETMHIHLSGPESLQVRRAKEMALDLVDAVTEEWKKARTAMGAHDASKSETEAPPEPTYDDVPPPPPSDPAPPPPPESAEVPPPPEDDVPPPPPTDEPPADPEPPAPEAEANTATLDEEEEAALQQYWRDYVKWEQSFVNYHGRRPTKEEGGQDVPPEHRA